MGSLDQARPATESAAAKLGPGNTSRPREFETRAGGKQDRKDSHHSTASPENLVARLYEEAEILYSQRDFTGAEVKVVQGLGIVERTVGKRHPDFALGQSMHAELRYLLGDVENAERLFREALEIRRTTIGEHHPNFATNLAGLAGLLAYKRRYDEAETLLWQAQAIRVELFGEQHPESIRGRNELARLLRRKGEWALAYDLVRSGSRDAPADLGDGGLFSKEDPARELVALSDLIKQLGDRSGPEALGLLRDGSPVPSSILEEMTGCRRRFTTLREKTKREGGSPPPMGLSIETLHELAAMLDDFYEADSRQRSREDVRRRALIILDRVLALEHVGRLDFPPLLECQEGAKVLRGAIALAPWNNLPTQTTTLSTGEHALTQLLTLALDRDALTDREWADRHEFVRDTLGQALASAASRGRLIFPAPRLKPTARSKPSAPNAEKVPRIEKLEIVLSANEQHSIRAGATVAVGVPSVEPMALEPDSPDGNLLRDLAGDLVVEKQELDERSGQGSSIDEGPVPENLEDELPPYSEAKEATDVIMPTGATVGMGTRPAGIEAASLSSVPYRRVGPGFVAGPLAMRRLASGAPDDERTRVDDPGQSPRPSGSKTEGIPSLDAESLNHVKD